MGSSQSLTIMGQYQRNLAWLSHTCSTQACCHCVSGQSPYINHQLWLVVFLMKRFLNDSLLTWIIKQSGLMMRLFLNDSFLGWNVTPASRCLGCSLPHVALIMLFYLGQPELKFISCLGWNALGNRQWIVTALQSSWDQNWGGEINRQF